MISANTKKRKYEDENRNFNLKWEEDFVFTVQDNKPLRLICHKLLGQNKCSNVKRHYEMNHKNFSNNFPPKLKVKKASKLS